MSQPTISDTISAHSHLLRQEIPLVARRRWRQRPKHMYKMHYLSLYLDRHLECARESSFSITSPHHPIHPFSVWSDDDVLRGWWDDHQCSLYKQQRSCRIVVYDEWCVWRDQNGEMAQLLIHMLLASITIHTYTYTQTFLPPMLDASSVEFSHQIKLSPTSVIVHCYLPREMHRFMMASGGVVVTFA